ncbi:MAG: hypothetical protein JWN52_7193 [Actinomycetia bacterium]|nr:hypothetical protein [Actinomycetes bacterium]
MSATAVTLVVLAAVGLLLWNLTATARLNDALGRACPAGVECSGSIDGQTISIKMTVQGDNLGDALARIPSKDGSGRNPLKEFPAGFDRVTFELAWKHGQTTDSLLRGHQDKDASAPTMDYINVQVLMGTAFSGIFGN